MGRMGYMTCFAWGDGAAAPGRCLMTVAVFPAAKPYSRQQSPARAAVPARSCLMVPSMFAIPLSRSLRLLTALCLAATLALFVGCGAAAPGETAPLAVADWKTASKNAPEEWTELV